jgi:hypothetical protein
MVRAEVIIFLRMLPVEFLDSSRQITVTDGSTRREMIRSRRFPYHTLHMAATTSDWLRASHSISHLSVLIKGSSPM